MQEGHRPRGHCFSCQKWTGGQGSEQDSNSIGHAFARVSETSEGKLSAEHRRGNQGPVRRLRLSMGRWWRGPGLGWGQWRCEKAWDSGYVLKAQGTGSRDPGLSLGWSPQDLPTRFLAFGSSIQHIPLLGSVGLLLLAGIFWKQPQVERESSPLAALVGFCLCSSAARPVLKAAMGLGGGWTSRAGGGGAA